ncbi:unnamed protein product [Plasmodium vivax]|uniref:(malaria parasite P. vivax) hypothetical protein n=1 Tax=Plasmodium vivax TaxID=5855 RepID=A0A8S4H5S0_PLAVI|nr:unnamed protein product [Plasmodium vivax]
MLNPAIEDLILNYDHYNTITKRFNRKPYAVYDEKYDVVLNYAKHKEWDRQKYNQTYEELYRHLRHGGVMFEYMVQGCKYISYMLHKHVIDVLSHYYDADSFKILRKYVEYFFKRESSKPNTLCLPHIVYVNDDMYKKLDNIYRLYNWYTDVVPWNNSWDEYKCKSFKIFLREYNDYIKNNQPTSTKLNEILTHFEGKVRKTIEGFGGKCSNYEYTLTPIVKYIKPEEVKPTHNPELEARSLQTLQQQVSEPQKIMMEEENHLKLPPTDHAPQEAKITRPHEGIYQAVKAEDTPVREEVAKTEFHSPDLHDDIIPRALARKETKEQSLYPQYELETEQGTMGKITGAITGVLREVEPGPILGVSGGMGALFLLFKYTPVGSFFGGRRGRFRQIPSSFRGFPQGDFANFQEYDGGSIGYSPMGISPFAE